MTIRISGGIACLLAVSLAVAPVALAEQPKDEAGRAKCKAYALVLMSDLNGQKSMLDMFPTLNPAPTKKALARQARQQAAYDADLKLFTSLKALYEKSGNPAPEVVKDMRDNMPMSQVKDNARACL